MRRRGLIGLGIVAAILAGVYASRNAEKSELTDEARRTAGGQYARVADGLVHYELAGPDTGRTVVLVHGFSVPYYIFDTTFATLRDSGFRVLRYDIFGRGFSDRPDVKYNGELFDRQLVALLDTLGIKTPIDIVGLSMGGLVVATFTANHPERVHSVTLLDPAFGQQAVVPTWARIPGFGEYFMTVAVAPEMAEGQLGDFVHPEQHPDWADRYRVQMRYSGFRRAILSTIREAGGRADSLIYGALGKTGRPVLLIWGEKDAAVPFARNEDVRRAVPQAEFVPVAEAGHLPHIERADVVIPALLRFLRS